MIERDVTPIVENQRDNMENEMETELTRAFIRIW